MTAPPFRAMQPRSVATVEALVSRLEEAGLEPTIARNYEQFPQFGKDVDMFLNSGPEHTTSVFAEVAQHIDWDCLTVCTHYMNVIAYRFHHFDPLETLLVDSIGSLTLWGQPLGATAELCSSRRSDGQGRFCRLADEWQYGYCLFQIESLLRGKVAETPKIERYRDQVLSFAAGNEQALEAWGKRCDLVGIGQALEALQSHDLAGFASRIREIKRRFMARRLRRNPASTGFGFLRRTWWLAAESALAPCGPVLKLKDAHRERWELALDTLVETRFLAGWDESRKQLRERQFAYVVFDPEGESYPDDDSGAVTLARRVAHRHRVVYEHRT